MGTNGGYVLIQQSNTVDLQKRWNFVAATCDFSDNDNNFEQGFGRRPTCNSIRTDLAYSATPSTGYLGSGIFFYLKSIQANKNYYITSYGSADACGTGTALTAFSLATIYNSIDPNKSNEDRFVGSSIAILGQSVAQPMSNKCWNTQTSLMGDMTTPTVAVNAPAIVPYQKELLLKQVTTVDSKNTDCNGTVCVLKTDTNLYREFTNIKLINATSAYVANSYLSGLFDKTTGNTEHYIYGSSVVSTNSYLALTIDINILDKTLPYEFLPTPIAYDLNSTSTYKGLFRTLPGR